MDSIASAGTGNNTAAPAPPRCHWKRLSHANLVGRDTEHRTDNFTVIFSCSTVCASTGENVVGLILPRCSEWPFSPHFRLYTRCPVALQFFRIFFRNTAGDLNPPDGLPPFLKKDVEFS